VPQGVADQVRDDSFGDRRVGHDFGQLWRNASEYRPPPRPEAVERTRDDVTDVRGTREHPRRPGLQPAHVEQAVREPGELAEGLFGDGQQFLLIVRGDGNVVRAQRADRRHGRGERRAQVVTDRGEQRRSPPVGLRRPDGLADEAVEQDHPCWRAVHVHLPSVGISGTRDA